MAIGNNVASGPGFRGDSFDFQMTDPVLDPVGDISPGSDPNEGGDVGQQPSKDPGVTTDPVAPTSDPPGPSPGDLVDEIGLPDDPVPGPIDTQPSDPVREDPIGITGPDISEDTSPSPTEEGSSPSPGTGARPKPSPPQNGAVDTGTDPEPTTERDPGATDDAPRKDPSPATDGSIDGSKSGNNRGGSPVRGGAVNAGNFAHGGGGGNVWSPGMVDPVQDAGDPIRTTSPGDGASNTRDATTTEQTRTGSGDTGGSGGENNSLLYVLAVLAGAYYFGLF